MPDAWLLTLGVVLVLSRDLTDAAQLPAAVVAGGLAAILALFALLVTETDEAFANVYSASVSLQNLMPRAPQPASNHPVASARAQSGRPFRAAISAALSQL